MVENTIRDESSGFFRPRNFFELDKNSDVKIIESFEYKNGVTYSVQKTKDTSQNKIIDINCKNLDNLIIRESAFLDYDTAIQIYSNLFLVHIRQNDCGNLNSITENSTTITHQLPDFIKKVKIK